MEPGSGRRVHILGGSGSGTTTLGASLAMAIGALHFDTDSIFWVPTDPPYREIRAVEERQQLLAQALDSAHEWVLSGSMDGWGDFAIPRFTLVVHLTLPQAERMARSRRREHARSGPRIQPGGDMHPQHLGFLAWAEQYDRARLDMRTRARHERWLLGLPCPVLRLDSHPPTAQLVDTIVNTFPVG